MPSTLAGLLVAIYLLIPGYCYYVVRRRTVPTRPLSTAVEGANLVVVAMLANAASLALYGLAQAVPFVRDHSPSIVQILRETESYLLESNSRLAYVGTWAAVLLSVSSGLAVAIAYRAWPKNLLAKLFGKALSPRSGSTTQVGDRFGVGSHDALDRTREIGTYVPSGRLPM